MKTETFGFTVETAYGNTLPKALDCVAEYDKFETFAEIEKSRLPDEREILNYVNAKAKASARASATNKALADAEIEKPTLASSPEMRLNNIIKSLVAAGLDEATARQRAEAVLPSA